MQWKREYIIILAIQITEVLGFSLILPFLPFYAQSLGASAFEVGLILTIFSLFQFVSAPIMGRLSDTYGRRPLLLLSQLSTFISFIVLGLANTLPLIYLSRIIDGLIGSNGTIAAAYLSDVSTKEDRSKVFGISGVAFGIGFFVGPAIGGYLSQFGFTIPSFLAAGITLITILLTYIFLPETVKNKKRLSFDWSKLFEIDTVKQYFSIPTVGVALSEFFLYVMAQSIFVSTFALYAEQQLQFTAQDIGYVLAAIGGLSILMRGVLLPKLIDWYGEHTLRVAGTMMMLLSLLTAPLPKNAWQFMPMMMLYAIGTGLSRPVLMGHISRATSDDQQGSVMGVVSSLSSISQIIGPLIGGFLIQHFIPGSLGLVGAIFMIGALILVTQEKTVIHWLQERK